MKEKEEIIEINNGESHRVLELAMEAGRILLRNGAEIFRVEETVWHICEHYGVQGLDTFVLSNGIFITADDGEKTIYAKTKHVPLSGAHLGIVAEVNALSREIVEEKVSVDEAFQRLKKIEQMPRTSKPLQTFASGMGAGSFCYIMGATLTESGIAFCIGVLLHVFLMGVKKYNSSKVIVNILGGAFITVLTLCAINFLPFPLRMDKLISGAIMPLVPGIAFTNAIRDIADSDILSGTVRMVDAVLVFVYIAVGAGTVLSIYNSLMGGMFL